MKIKDVIRETRRQKAAEKHQDSSKRNKRMGGKVKRSLRSLEEE